MCKEYSAPFKLLKVLTWYLAEIDQAMRQKYIVFFLCVCAFVYFCTEQRKQPDIGSNYDQKFFEMRRKKCLGRYSVLEKLWSF